MKRKPLNKSRLYYLKQNTPLNVVPEKKLKKADLTGLIENRGKSRFRTKKLRERVESLIRSDLVFKNKTNAKPLTLLGTTSNLLLVRAPLARNTLKAKESFHLNMNAKRSVHLLVLPTVKQSLSTSAGNAKQQPSCSADRRYLTTSYFSKSCLIKTFGCILKSNTCINQILEKNKSINTPSLIGLCKATPWFVEGVAGSAVRAKKQEGRKQHKRRYSSLSAKQLLVLPRDAEHVRAKSGKVANQIKQSLTTTTTTTFGRKFISKATSQGCVAWHSNVRYAALPTFSKAHEQEKTVEKNEIGTNYIVKRTFIGSTRNLSNTRFKVHSQDLKQLIEGRGRKVSPYKARLLERKKLSLIYGNLGWRELRKCVLQSKHKKGVASPKSGNKKTRPQTSSLPENLITLLESRLDVVLYRCRFFPSFSSCKQAINHGKILVNHRQVRIAGHLLKAGDLIQVSPQSKQSLLVQTDSTVDPLRATFKPEITPCEPSTKKVSSSACGKEHKQSLPNCFANQSSSRAAIGSKTFVPCPDSTRLGTHKQKHVASKRANCLLALENEKQKTLLYFQNKIKSRPFSPSLPSALLTRFDPLHHFPWNTKQKQNHPLHNNTFLGDLPSVDPSHGRPKVGHGHANDPLSTTFKRTKTPLSLNLENQANSLFRDLKERKRILRTLSSRSNLSLDGYGESFKQKQHMPRVRSTDRLIKPLRNRDNPSLFLRPQSKSGVASQKRKEHNTSSSTSLARAATGLKVFMGTKHANKSEHLLRGTNLGCKAIPSYGRVQSIGLKKLFPPFYRAVKPLNLEVSYQTLTAIFLFPPQKVYFPAHIDLEMISRSI